MTVTGSSERREPGSLSAVANVAVQIEMMNFAYLSKQLLTTRTVFWCSDDGHGYCRLIFYQWTQPALLELLPDTPDPLRFFVADCWLSAVQAPRVVHAHDHFRFVQVLRVFETEWSGRISPMFFLSSPPLTSIVKMSHFLKLFWSKVARMTYFLGWQRCCLSPLLFPFWCCVCSKWYSTSKWPRNPPPTPYMTSHEKYYLLFKFMDDRSSGGSANLVTGRKR